MVPLYKLTATTNRINNPLRLILAYLEILIVSPYGSWWTSPER